MKNMDSHIGHTYNQLTVQSLSGYKQRTGYRRRLAVCECSCGQVKELELSYVVSGKQQSCGCLPSINNRTDEGWPEVCGYLGMIRGRAKTRKYDFNLTQEYLLSIWDGKCALSGLEINICPFFQSRKKTKVLLNTKQHYRQTASLDRIDCTKGYVKGNVRWVHVVVNQMRSDLTDEEFYSYIESIYNFRSGSKLSRIQ